MLEFYRTSAREKTKASNWDCERTNEILHCNQIGSFLLENLSEISKEDVSITPNLYKFLCSLYVFIFWLVSVFYLCMTCVWYQ